MRRLRLFPCLAGLIAAGCTVDAPRDVIPPAAQVAAPARLGQRDVTDPPAPAPTARGTYASMTPPFMQHTPPRPHTRSAPPVSGETPLATSVAAASVVPPAP